MLKPWSFIPSPNFKARTALSWPIISLNGARSWVDSHCIKLGSHSLLSFSTGNLFIMLKSPFNPQNYYTLNLLCLVIKFLLPTFPAVSNQALTFIQENETFD